MHTHTRVHRHARACTRARVPQPDAGLQVRIAARGGSRYQGCVHRLMRLWAEGECRWWQGGCGVGG